VSGLSPSVVSTAGGVVVSVQGLGLGGRDGDIMGVTIGGRSCSEVQVVSGQLLRCRVPPGVGSQLGVVVINAIGQASQSVPLFSYAPPIVASVDPPYFLTAPRGSPPIDVALDGSSLCSGNVSDAKPEVYVGG